MSFLKNIFRRTQDVVIPTPVKFVPDDYDPRFPLRIDHPMVTRTYNINVDEPSGKLLDEIESSDEHLQYLKQCKAELTEKWQEELVVAGARLGTGPKYKFLPKGFTVIIDGEIYRLVKKQSISVVLESDYIQDPSGAPTEDFYTQYSEQIKNLFDEYSKSIKIT